MAKQPLRSSRLRESENKKSLSVKITQETFFEILLYVNIHPHSRGNLHLLDSLAKFLR
jgi:hypothetical protein